MIFLNFGRELINLSQIYQIDLREADDGKSVVIVFFYHLANTEAGGYKVSKTTFNNIDAALNALVSMGIEIRTVNLGNELTK